MVKKYEEMSRDELIATIEARDIEIAVLELDRKIGELRQAMSWPPRLETKSH